jgi:hypothetical protein
MGIELFAILHMRVFLAIVDSLYGALIALFCSPLLLARRFRRLFDSLPPAD